MAAVDEIIAMAKAHPVELFPVDTKVTEDEDFTFGNHVCQTISPLLHLC